MNLDIFKNGASFAIGRTGLVLKKYSPEILTTVGIAGVVTSAVLASRATLKLEPVIVRSQQKLYAINAAIEDGVVDIETRADELAVVRAKGAVYVETGLDLTKLYGPAVAVGTASIVCILSAHGIMRQRNAALVAAYTVMEKGFQAYRSRVVEEFGEEKDRDYLHGLVTTEVTNEKGETHKEVTLHPDPNVHSVYARFFDEYNINWEKQAEKNLFFLKSQQNYWNDVLHTRGHVFLNEVYDSIGLEHSQAGAVVGWLNDEKSGDTFIDFGIWDLYNDQARMFVNGLERSILLDFNVDGTIFDKIGNAQRPRRRN